MTQALDGLGPVVDRYDVFLLDMWGCVHDGVHVFAGVADFLARVRGQGKKAIVLSNAPRRVPIIVKQMPNYGVHAEQFDAIVTSGEDAWRAMAVNAHKLGPKFLHIGQDANLTDPAEIGLREVKSLADADFILASGAAGDGTLEMEKLRPVLKEGVARGLKMICANPDLEVLRGEERYLCAGTAAAAYETLGGTVHYHGKPHRGVYEWALELAGQPDRKRVLAVGDAMRTDVAGGRGAGVDQAFIPGGIHAVALGSPMGTLPSADKMTALSAEFGFAPTYMLAELRW